MKEMPVDRWLTGPDVAQIGSRAHRAEEDALLTSIGWPADGYRLFEFSIDHAVFGERGDADAWPPRYTSWRNPAPGS